MAKYSKYLRRAESRADFRGAGAELALSARTKDAVALAKSEPTFSGAEI